MRGHHAYKDEFQPEINKTLPLQREPENAKDPHAVATTENNRRVVGHTSFRIVQIVSSFLKRVNHREAVICGKRVNRGVGMGLEIPVLYKLYGEHKYLTRLDELIMGSDMAGQSLRAKQEGISSTAQVTRKRKSVKNIEMAKETIKCLKSNVNKAEKDRNILYFCLSILSTEMKTNGIFKDKVLFYFILLICPYKDLIILKKNFKLH